jgi:hypothetical protein
MKKTILMLASASALIAGMASCKKQELPNEPKEAITQTVNVKMKVDESYSFTLPKNLRDDPYEITIKAQHALISQVGTNQAGDKIFSYTPTKGYNGPDQVVVSNDQEREEHMNQKGNHQGPPKGKKHHKGKCEGPKGEEDHYILTFNFVVDDTNTSSLTAGETIK